MRRRIAIIAAAALAAAAGLFFSPTAHAGGQLCYDVNVQVADQAPVAQTGCQAVPDLPALPALP